jgi:hypothetical protein
VGEQVTDTTLGLVEWSRAGVACDAGKLGKVLIKRNVQGVGRRKERDKSTEKKRTEQRYK